jgi:DNA-binding transcriptional regulator YdaS (Cro superfamily)
MSPMDKKLVWAQSADAVRRACQAAGSITELARKLKVESPTVNGWINGDCTARSARLIPLDQAIETERVLNGAVTAEEMRPDKASHIRFLRGDPSAALPANATHSTGKDSSTTV